MTCEEPAYFQHICTCGEILLSGASPFTPSGHKFSVEDYSFNHKTKSFSVTYGKCLNSRCNEVKDPEIISGEDVKREVKDDSNCNVTKVVYYFYGDRETYYSDEYTENIPHTWENGVCTVETCGYVCPHQGGESCTAKAVCTECGMTYGDEPAGHVPGPAATCTSPQVCANGCGYVYKPATGHNYSGMTSLKYTNLGANHDVDGICPNCGGEIGYVEAHIYYPNVDGGKKCPCGAINPDYVAPIPDGLNPEDGWVYENGEKSDFTGLYPYDGGLFYILNGQWQRGANGLTLIIDEFWFLANGQVQEHHGFAEYDGEWFYLDGEGKLDVTASGVYNYNGKTFLVAAGRLVSEYSGLAQIPSGEWYYVAEGRVLTEFTGEIEWNGATFQIVNGKLVA